MLRRLTETQKGIVALVLLAFVFATMGIFARYLGTSFALFEQTYLRIALAFLLSMLFFAKDMDIQKLRTIPQKDMYVLVFRAVAMYLGVALFTEAILHTKYGNVSFITAVPLLPVFGYFAVGERLALKTLLAIGLGFLGMTLFTFDPNAFSFGYGEIIALLSMLAFDFSYVARRFHSDHLNNKETTAFMFAVGAMFLFATSCVLGEPMPQMNQFTTLILGALFFSALFNVANLFLTNYGFQRVKVGVAGNILALETVFALGYSVFLFGEVPLVRELGGGALILLSVYLVNRYENTT